MRTNLKTELTLAFLLSVLSACGFLTVAALIGFHQIRYFDNLLISLIQGMESPVLTRIMLAFTFIGSGYVVALLAVLVMLFQYTVLGHRHELLLFLWTVAGSGVLNIVLKGYFHRVRPQANRLIEVTGYSFPSGHSMAAFTFYGIVTYLLWLHVSTASGRALLFCISTAMIIGIGVSRIYLGVHYPSDVIGGYLASGTFLGLSIWADERYQKRRQVHTPR